MKNKNKLLLSSVLTLASTPISSLISPEVIAKAWRDPSYYESLDEQTKKQIPQNPVGNVNSSWRFPIDIDAEELMSTQSSLCNTQDSTCSTVDSTCSTVDSTCSTVDSTCSTADSTCSTVDSTCSTADSTCSTADAACTAPSLCNG